MNLKNHTMTARITAVAAVLTITPLALAAFSMPRHLIAGGGGQSTGGAWTARSALGQPCAGPVTSGSASVTSGFFAGAFAPPPCPGDLNGDRLINTLDLVGFLARFGLIAPPGSPEALADLNSDGVVNTSDLVFFLGRFGTACPN